MKRLALALFIALVLTLSACSGGQETRGRFNSINFEAYTDTFDAMFGYEWTLLSVEEIDIWEWTYTEWTIEYRDGNEELRQFVLDNRLTVCTTAISYLRRIAEYYREQFLDVYLDGLHVSFAHPAGFTSGSIVRADEKWICDESEEWIRATGGYRRGLSTPEGAIPFSRLTPATVFELVPFYLSVNIVFDESSDLDQGTLEEEVTARIEEMLQGMNQFANHRLNANVRLGHTQWGEATQVWQYIQGERVEIEAWAEDSWHVAMNHWSSPFELAVFESYRGVFW